MLVRHLDCNFILLVGVWLKYRFWVYGIKWNWCMLSKCISFFNQPSSEFCLSFFWDMKDPTYLWRYIPYLKPFLYFFIYGPWKMSYISYMSMYLLTSRKSTLRCQTFYCLGELYLKPFSQCMTKKKNNKYNVFFTF